MRAFNPHDARLNKRLARPDEVCSCGRKAAIVYLTDEYGEVPWCGQTLAELRAATQRHPSVPAAYRIKGDLL